MKQKLYAIVIGDRKKDQRYIAFHHLPSNAITSEYPLAIYENYQTARKARHKILKEINHKDVYIKRGLFDLGKRRKIGKENETIA